MVAGAHGYVRTMHKLASARISRILLDPDAIDCYRGCFGIHGESFDFQGIQQPLNLERRAYREHLDSITRLNAEDSTIVPVR